MPRIHMAWGLSEHHDEGVKAYRSDLIRWSFGGIPLLARKTESAKTISVIRSVGRHAG